MKFEYSPLSPKQIKDFLEQNNIDALDIREIENYTVILYQTPTEHGYWRLTSDQSCRISASSGSSDNNSDITKVSVGRSEGGGVKSGQIKFITIIINDNEILEKAERIVVNSGNQKSEELINRRKGIIISDLGEEGSEELIITLLDEAGKPLFSSKLQGIDSKVTDIINELKKGNFSRINTESQSVLNRL